MAARTAAERGQQARQKLLDAATELIVELGWNAISTRIVASRAGLASGLVHYHFQSLQALLREAALRALREELATASAMFAHADALEAGLGTMLRSLDAYTGSDPASLLFVETYLAATRDERLRGELTALIADVRGDLAGWLGDHGQQDAHQTASVLAAAIDGVLLHRALDPGLTSAVVAPVLRRVLTPTEAARDD